MKRRIAFFDFDGTITTADTLEEIIKYQKGQWRYWIGIVACSPHLIAWKLGIIKNSTAKARVMRHFFGNMPLEEFQRKCDAFATEVLPKLLRPKALEEIKRMQQEGVKVVIVSASPGNWSEVWRNSLGLESLTTCLQVNGSKLTGRFEGLNCYGQEKARRITDEYKDLNTYDEIYCYGDSKGDKEMLALAHFKFYKPFR